MMLSRILLLAFVFIASCVKAQLNHNIHIVSGPGFNSVSSLQVLPVTDGTLLYAQAGTETPTRVYNNIINLDTLGNVLWQSHIDEISQIGGIVELDSHYAVIGEDNDGFLPMYIKVKKYPKSGSLKPHQYYNYSFTSDSIDPIQCYIQKSILLKDRNWLVVGSSANATGDFFPIVVKLDSNLVPIWGKGYPAVPEIPQNEVDDAFFHSVLETSDSGFIVVGELLNYLSGVGGINGIVIKFDSDGNPEWQKYFVHDAVFTASNVKFFDIADAGNDNYIVVGQKRLPATSSSGWNAMLLKIDIDGDVKWVKGYGTPDEKEGDLGYNQIKEEYFGILPTSNDEFILNGKMTAPDGYYPLYATIDSSGAVKKVVRWQETNMTGTQNLGLWRAERAITYGNTFIQPFIWIDGWAGFMEFDTTLSSPCGIDTNFTAISIDDMAWVDTTIFKPEPFTIATDTGDTSFVKVHYFNAKFGNFCDTVLYEAPDDTSTYISKASSNRFQVSPNPANDLLDINGLPTGTLMTIMDITGNIVRKERLTSARSINVSSIPNGLYIIQSIGSNVETRKIIIQR